MNKSLSYGVSSRLARIAPKENLRYGKWEIPAGVRYSPTHLTRLSKVYSNTFLPIDTRRNEHHASTSQ